MNRADDLRNAYKKHVGWDGERHYDEFISFLAEAATDPVRRLAILDAMGLDVTEGWICSAVAGRTQFVARGQDAHPWDEPRAVGPCRDCKPSMLVRPRGEATDA